MPEYCRGTHVDDLRVLTVQQVTEGWNDSTLYQGRHLFASARDAEVGDGPGRFLLCLELSLAEVLHDLGQQTRVDHRLHLLLVPGRDVRQEPDRLLADLLFLLTNQCLFAIFILTASLRKNIHSKIKKLNELGQKLTVVPTT